MPERLRKSTGFLSIRMGFITTLITAYAALLAACGGTVTASDPIVAIMSKPRYVSAQSKWSMVVMDAKTGEVLYSIQPDTLSLTGSVRKIFSVGSALDTLGPGYRFNTAIYRNGTVDAASVLNGDLIVKAAGDLVFGGRQKPDGTLDFTDFDHNEARGFNGAILTPEDPLVALNSLAAQVRAAGIQKVNGDVVIDDRLFDSFRVPNGNVLISPMLINENVIDVTLLPGAAIGQPGQIDWRPKTTAFTMRGTSITSASGTTADIMVSGDALGSGSLSCLAAPSCSGTLSSTESLAAPASIPLDYRAALIGNNTYVNILRVEDPPSFARTAFIDALTRAGVTVSALPVTANPSGKLPPAGSYTPATQVASFTSPPYSEYAKLILKVSLNTGANLSLMHLGLSQGARTVSDALAVERSVLTQRFGLDPAGFDFPTNGSGTPDSRATARTTATMLEQMSHRPTYAVYRAALPVLGTDGSLAAVGTTVTGKEHISVKSGATIDNGEMVALSMAGYVDAKSGRSLTVALFVNHAGPLTALTDTIDVFDDEAQILGIVYQRY